MRCKETETNPTQDDLTISPNEMSYCRCSEESITTAAVMGKNTLNANTPPPPPPPPQESQSCLTPIPKACVCQSMSLGRSCMFQKTKEIKTCCGKSTFVRWRRHHSLQHVCRVVCLCRLQMWFAVEKQDVFSFSQPSPAGMCRQRCGWAGMYACPHVHFTVLSAGCAVIHNVTVNTYCEKEKELPRVLF